MPHSPALPFTDEESGRSLAPVSEANGERNEEKRA